MLSAMQPVERPAPAPARLPGTRRTHLLAALLPALLALPACSTEPESESEPSTGTPGTAGANAQDAFEIRAGKPVASLPGELRLQNVRQLTFGGENAEAYWSHDGTRLVYQTKRPPYDCDQIHVLDLRTGEDRLVSTGKGRTTCSYFLQDDEHIVYASTHLADEDCPVAVARHQGRYVWPIFEGYDVFRANADGTDLVRLTETPGYDAEATVCPVTGRIVFTSVRDGDLELYAMDPDGGNVKRLTDRPGYDGGAFYSHDGKKLVQRSGFFANDAEEEEYFGFLKEGLVVPTKMEITVLDADGGNFRQVTDNGKANFAPYWHPDNERIMFSSNMNDPRGRDFDLFLIREDGTGLEQITANPTFDGFPMWSPDGRHLVFASNRYGSEPGETNIFVAEWIEEVTHEQLEEAARERDEARAQAAEQGQQSPHGHGR
jgi:TolB protein